MPVDRLISPRLGQSKKVSSLDDFEARVWSHGFLLAADDYGVMPYSPLLLRANNAALSTRSDEDVRAALDRLVEIKLLLRFVHQEQSYLCDPVWQNYQHVRYPRQTVCPCPPEETLQKLSGNTLKLFRTHHEGFPKSFKRGGDLSLANANANANANAQFEGEEGGGGGKKGAVKRLIDAYHDKFLARFRKKPVINGPKDGATFKRLLRSQTEQDILACLDRFIAEDDAFTDKAGHTVGVFASRFNGLLVGGRGRSLPEKTRQNLDARREALARRGIKA